MDETVRNMFLNNKYDIKKFDETANQLNQQ